MSEFSRRIVSHLSPLKELSERVLLDLESPVPSGLRDEVKEMAEDFPSGLGNISMKRYWNSELNESVRNNYCEELRLIERIIRITTLHMLSTTIPDMHGIDVQEYTRIQQELARFGQFLAKLNDLRKLYQALCQVTSFEKSICAILEEHGG
jgi:hypothetical protein